MVYYVRKGRIGNSSLPHNSKCPILLNRKHYLTKLIVLSCHNRVKNNGLRYTFAEVRSLYWITRGKSYMKNVLSHCIVCRRINGTPYVYPVSPDLPKFRVNIDYTCSGVDID